jgi:hypothetical protein
VQVRNVWLGQPDVPGPLGFVPPLALVALACMQWLWLYQILRKIAHAALPHLAVKKAK